MSTTIDCGICSSERATLVNAFLEAGRSFNWIERQMRDLGFPTKSETVSKHLQRCLGGQRSNAKVLESAASGETVNPNADFAVAIRAEANRALAAGTLRVTAQHGLAAQALIDRRAEKAADRQLMVQIAGLLSGAHSEVPADMIEGEWREVPGEDGDEHALIPVALVRE